MKGSLAGLDSGYDVGRRVPAPGFTSHSCVTTRPWLLSVAQLPERVFPSGNLWNPHVSIRVSFHAAESDRILA